MTSAIVSGITGFEYKLAVNAVLDFNLFVTRTTEWKATHFLNKDAPLKLTDQENTTVAISFLVIIFSTIEIALAFCTVWSSDSLYQPTQENEISHVCEVIYLLYTPCYSILPHVTPTAFRRVQIPQNESKYHAVFELQKTG